MHLYRDSTFAYAKWIIKHPSASVVICVVHAKISLSGKRKAPVTEVYGASFMTAAEDVLQLSGILGSCRRTQMNKHTHSPLWKYLHVDASSPCLCYESQSCITMLCLLTSLSWEQKWVNLCYLPPKAPLHLPEKTGRCAQKSWRIFVTCCPAVIRHLCLTHAPLHHQWCSWHWCLTAGESRTRVWLQSAASLEQLRSSWEAIHPSVQPAVTLPVRRGSGTRSRAVIQLLFCWGGKSWCYIFIWVRRGEKLKKNFLGGKVFFIWEGVQWFSVFVLAVSWSHNYYNSIWRIKCTGIFRYPDNMLVSTTAVLIIV